MEKAVGSYFRLEKPVVMLGSALLSSRRERAGRAGSYICGKCRWGFGAVSFPGGDRPWWDRGFKIVRELHVVRDGGYGEGGWRGWERDGRQSAL